MKKRAFISILCALLVSSAAYAKSLVITLTDGTLVYYLLGSDTNPKLHFVDGGIMINADNYALEGVKNFYISNEDDPNAIKDVFTDDKMEIRDNVLIIPSTETVSVYTTAGKQVQANSRLMSNKTIIDLNALPQGSYVINIGKTSFKIMKR
ncbi:MAG: T9SS type A sorting domain-containing protein [Bacteroidales bacterium]|nr:T9SS type A sorting domain-containing protein [Bacteroidales bacterium]